jgi:hypothetical protein
MPVIVLDDTHLSQRRNSGLLTGIAAVSRPVPETYSTPEQMFSTAGLWKISRGNARLQTERLSGTA